MSRHRRKRKCQHCEDLFLPDPRNMKRQKYCSKLECRQACKSESQRRWLAKEENRDYFKGPHQVRRVQHQFSWVDQRLVRERHIGRCSHTGAALYLFQLTVSDANGFSYYTDTSIMQGPGMDAPTLHVARESLLHHAQTVIIEGKSFRMKETIDG